MKLKPTIPVGFFYAVKPVKWCQMLNFTFFKKKIKYSFAYLKKIFVPLYGRNETNNNN